LIFASQTLATACIRGGKREERRGNDDIDDVPHSVLPTTFPPEGADIQRKHQGVHAADYSSFLHFRFAFHNT